MNYYAVVCCVVDVGFLGHERQVRSATYQL